MKISEVLPNGNVRLVITMTLRRVKHRQVIVAPESEGGVIEKSPVLIAIANGFLWQKMLDERKVTGPRRTGKKSGKGTRGGLSNAPADSPFSANHPHCPDWNAAAISQHEKS